MSLTTPFLLKGVGFSLKTIGVVNKSLGMLATIAGVFTGGVLLMRLGLFRALLIFGILQALTNLLFYALAIVGNNMTMLVLAVGLDNFGGGLGTAAFMALVMSLCHPRFTATQFALLSALAAIGRVYVGPVAGWLVDTVGWAEFYAWTVVVAVPGIILLWSLRDVITQYDQEGVIDGIHDVNKSRKSIILAK
jgi:PAT family beta-lactamase induction signal transducer AmpG